jgi:hypothetical protein
MAFLLCRRGFNFVGTLRFPTPLSLREETNLHLPHKEATNIPLSLRDSHYQRKCGIKRRCHLSHTMKAFLQLTTRVINASHIVQIVTTPTSYCIHMTTQRTSGVFLFSSGSLSSYPDTIQICKTKQASDYDAVTRFLGTL